MKLAADGPMAIPLWINGRAYLTVTEAFLDVCDPVTGEAIRRTPLAGADEVAEAVLAASGAQTGWGVLSTEERQAYLQQLARLLDQYTGHFARLVQQETGCDEAAAQSEVAAAVAALQGETQTPAGIVAIIVDASSPLAAVATSIAPFLRGGACVVVKPSPRAPGAAFALAELSGRAGFPAGVFNLVHGDLAALEAISSHAGIESLEVSGEASFVAQVREFAGRHGRALN